MRKVFGQKYCCDAEEDIWKPLRSEGYQPNATSVPSQWQLKGVKKKICQRAKLQAKELL